MGNLLKGLIKIGEVVLSDKLNQNSKDTIQELKDDINHLLNKSK